MLTLSTLVIAALLNGFLTDARFPEYCRAYHVDFGNELKGKVIFLSDSEMVYGDLDKKGELRKIDIVKVSAQTFIVVWNEGPENAVRIEHR
ncbi:MAG TPA: hypothetical protein VFH43_08730, partial [Candidatus Kapabacteria bacterium]|nr:hypothetical protein [Candidatus Kapabacteria bacterium]